MVMNSIILLLYYSRSALISYCNSHFFHFYLYCKSLLPCLASLPRVLFNTSLIYSVVKPTKTRARILSLCVLYNFYFQLFVLSFLLLLSAVLPDLEFLFSCLVIAVGLCLMFKITAPCPSWGSPVQYTQAALNVSRDKTRRVSAPGIDQLTVAQVSCHRIELIEIFVPCHQCKSRLCRSSCLGLIYNS